MPIFSGNVGHARNKGHLRRRLGQGRVAQIHQKGPIVNDASACVKGKIWKLGTADNFPLGRKSCGLASVQKDCKSRLLVDIYLFRECTSHQEGDKESARKKALNCLKFSRISMSSCLLPVAISSSIVASHFYFLQPGCATVGATAARKRGRAHCCWCFNRTLLPHTEHVLVDGGRWWPEQPAFECLLS